LIMSSSKGNSKIDASKTFHTCLWLWEPGTPG
jgi:hypothetical protein